jgi:chromosome segregation ATPase
MGKLMSKINPAVFMTVVLVFSGCVHQTNSGKDTSPARGPSVAGDQYSREIVELNQVVQQNSNPDKAKKTHLELAQLYSNHKNPRRNYQKALKHLKAYYQKALKHLKAYSAFEDFAEDDETQNWMAALKEIDHLSKEIATQNKQIRRLQSQLDKSKKARLAIKKSNRKLTSEEIKLREKNRKLEESNQKLQKTIEMLKNLDKRLEEKRKNFNN